jgi:hypothetical protein
MRKRKDTMTKDDIKRGGGIRELKGEFICYEYNRYIIVHRSCRKRCKSCAYPCLPVPTLNT